MPPPAQPNNPLHGITLEMILTQLVAKYGWPELARRIELRCFSDHPSISSSLKVLRRNPWARGKLERMYVEKMVKRVRASERGSG